MRVYLDHNSTTPMVPAVRERYLELLGADLGNASSVHASGRRARAVIDDARERIAGALDVPEESIFFTSGGTEANNMALFGSFPAQNSGETLLVSAVEHSSVLEAAAALGERDVEVRILSVDRQGRVKLDELERLARDPVCRLVSVMTANNEVGTVMPMAEIGAVLQELGDKRPLWHTDAVQALGRVPLQLAEWGVDLVSFSAHKLGGPRGVGFLVDRRRRPLRPLLVGGGQEQGQRAGTENVPGIGATALAVELAVAECESRARRARSSLVELWTELVRACPEVRICGPKVDSEERLPNTLAVLFEEVDGHSLVAHLDLDGLEASVGSACSSGALEPSHVLLAMGLSEGEARAVLRLSLGPRTSSQDIHSAVETLRKTLSAIRSAR